MWMNYEDTVVFDDIDGSSISVKDMRLIPEYSSSLSIATQHHDTLDEIATRNYIYGEGMESLSYALFEANVVALADAMYDLTKIRSVRIPVV
jgi:hypothetical protein